MKAKDMFEKLEYEKDILTNNTLGYKKIKNHKIKYITFVNVGISKYITIIEDNKPNPIIDLQELQAINKQVEELGWNNVASNR